MICLVTDRKRVSGGPDAAERLVDLVASAARAGVDLIQIRERDLDARALLALVRTCLKAAEGTGAKYSSTIALTWRWPQVHMGCTCAAIPSQPLRFGRSFQMVPSSAGPSTAPKRRRRLRRRVPSTT